MVEKRILLEKGFENQFGKKDGLAFFSAPGRVELGGNHTDHQRGKVLAAAVNLYAMGAAAPNGSELVRIKSKGYPLIEIPIGQLDPQPLEKNTSAALARGILHGFLALGASLGGFDAYIDSEVLPGSGLSSSAAFEILLGQIGNSLLFDGKAGPLQLARLGQLAENDYFGKPSGLMDQTACSLGGVVAVDFLDPRQPCVEKLTVDFETLGYTLCIINCGAGHDDLTEEYASIPREMGKAASFFGKKELRQVEEEIFYRDLSALRQKVGDRAALRAMHFFDEERRVEQQTEALRRGDIESFLRLVRQSGRSSEMLLQNISPAGSGLHQELRLALALCEKLLEDKGACRVHGGGFAGTVEAFVPNDMIKPFIKEMESFFFPGCCMALKLSPEGGKCWEED